MRALGSVISKSIRNNNKYIYRKMRASDCCRKGCLKMWLLVTQLCITIIYLIYFCDLIFRYDTTVAEFSKHFPDQTSIKVGIGIIFVVAVYLVLNTFCGCCVAWQPERCIFITFIVCSVFIMIFVLGASLYSIISYSFYPIGVSIYLVLAILSLFFASKIRSIKDEKGYDQLLEEMIDREAEELYSYAGAQTLAEKMEIK